jgi:hypothetical protein
VYVVKMEGELAGIIWLVCFGIGDMNGVQNVFLMGMKNNCTDIICEKCRLGLRSGYLLLVIGVQEGKRTKFVACCMQSWVITSIVKCILLGRGAYSCCNLLVYSAANALMKSLGSKYVVNVSFGEIK